MNYYRTVISNVSGEKLYISAPFPEDKLDNTIKFFDTSLHEASNNNLSHLILLSDYGINYIIPGNVLKGSIISFPKTTYKPPKE